MISIKIIDGDKEYIIWTSVVPVKGSKIVINDKRYKVEDVEYQVKKNAVYMMNVVLYVKEIGRTTIDFIEQ